MGIKTPPLDGKDLTMKKNNNNNDTKEKIIEFTNLLELFKNCKGTDIELNNKYNNDKYSIQIYSSGVEGNLNINGKSKLHIIFLSNDELVEVAPCNDNEIYNSDLGFSFPTFSNITAIDDLIDPNFLNALTDYISNIVEKSITFEDLLKLFKDNKGKDIMLNKTNDKYSIRVYDNMYCGVTANFNIKYCANVQIFIKDDRVLVTPCKRGECLYHKGQKFKLNDDIMKMKDLLPNDYLTALINYMK